MSLKLRLLVFIVVVMTTFLINTATADLAGWWKLNDGQGTVAVDSSGNGRDGTFIDNPTWDVGLFGRALRCWNDGGIGGVKLPDMPDFTPEECTLCGWIFQEEMIGAWNYFFGNHTGEPWGLMRANTNNLRLNWPGGSGGWDADSGLELPVGEWAFVAASIKPTSATLYVNSASWTRQANFGPANFPNENFIGRDSTKTNSSALPGLIDDFRLYSHALTEEEIAEVMLGEGDSGFTDSPDPANNALDVWQGAVLSWQGSEFATTHNVYLDTDFNDVNDADNSSALLVGPGLVEATFTPDSLLTFGKTYYWRVDEVNDSDPKSPWKGDVWSFTVEPFAYPIEDIIANASSSNTADEGPENTVNSSGLNDNLHSTVLTDMWFTAAGEPAPAWIQYDFDKAYKLHEMLVWNYNGPSFLTAVGLKDVVVEYSSDGTDLVQIDSVSEFARASGLDDYPPNTTVPLDGILAKSVKISASSNWSGGFSDQFGLSEVQILQIPVNAREPFPVSGATDVDVDVILGWRAGREAVTHDVYISDDPNALTLADSVNKPVFDTTSQGLALGQSYHWRIDEVNDAETPTTWQGELWNFTTQEYIVVDDFESYNTTDRQIWEIWLDGLGFGTAGTPNYNPGNGTGSAVGDENSPSYMEETIVHSGSKSVPVAYNNSAATSSEVTVNTSDLPIGGNWTKGAAVVLVLWFYGDPANATTERMYVKANGIKVSYPGDAADIAIPKWKLWNIDLTAFGGDMNNVPQLTIGFERTGGFGGSGKVLIDDIRLYRLVPEAYLIADFDTDATNANDWLNNWGSGGRFTGRSLSTDTPDGSDNAIQIDIDYTAGGWGSAWGAFSGTQIGPAGTNSFDASDYACFSVYLKSSIDGAQINFWFEHFPGPTQGYVNQVTIAGITTEWAYYEVDLSTAVPIRDGLHDMTAVNRMSFGGPADLGAPYTILLDQLYFNP